MNGGAHLFKNQSQPAAPIRYVVIILTIIIQICKILLITFEWMMDPKHVTEFALLFFCWNKNGGCPYV